MKPLLMLAVCTPMAFLMFRQWDPPEFLQNFLENLNWSRLFPKGDDHPEGDE